MIEAALIFAFGCFGLGLLFNLWRIATGPEASMLVAMVGFVSTVAYCRFVLRGDIIE